MDRHSGKLTRRTLLGRLGAGALAMVAGTALFNEQTAFASSNPAPTPTPTPSSPPAVDRTGTLIVRPAAGATIAQVNAKFGTRTVMAFTGGTQWLVWSPRVILSLIQMRMDRRLVAWVELNSRVKTPRRKLGAVNADDDAGSDGSLASRLVSDP